MGVSKLKQFPHTHTLATQVAFKEERFTDWARGGIIKQSRIEPGCVLFA